MQEALEEAGVTGRISAQPLGRYRYKKRVKTGERLPLAVAVYPLEVTAVLETWPEEAQRDRAWIALAEASERAQKAGLRRVLAGVTADHLSATGDALDT
jgi:hypothetical protein